MVRKARALRNSVLVEALESRVLMTALPAFGRGPVVGNVGVKHATRHVKASHAISLSASVSATFPAPANAAATALAPTQVSVTWGISTGATGYYVYRTKGNTNFSKIATVSGGSVGSYLDKSVSAATTYSYYVVAFNSTSQSVNSNIATVTTPSATSVAPVAPTNLKISKYATSALSLTWSNGAKNALGIHVYRSTDGSNFSLAATLSASAASYTDNGLISGTKYWYEVGAYNSAGENVTAAVSGSTTGTAPVTVVAPNAPTGLTVGGSTANSLSLAWTNAASNATGIHVYRSTDGTNFSLVATLASSATSYSDSTLAPGTTYWYEVAAYNSAGENGTAPASGTTATVTPSSSPISISTRYGDELVLAGDGGNDSIYVSQSGSTLTITGNGITSTAAAPAAGLFIYSYGGNTSVTVDSSVTLRTTIETIDGATTTIHSGGSNVSAWVDSNDSFSGTGIVHSVANFYGGVSKGIGIRIADPTDAGTTFVDNASLWGTGPVAGDVNQGGVGDCYYLASLAGFAQSMPAKLEEMAVDMGDGTFAVEYMRGGTPSFVRVDNDIPTGPYWGYGFAHPGASGDIWAMIMEKSYALFRSGANSYASLDNGWMGNVYSDVGIANTSVSLSTTDSQLFSLISNALNQGKAVTFGTFSSGTTLVSSHAYTVMSVENIGGVNYYTVRNPWGFSGDSLEDGNGIAMLTFSQMVQNFQLGTMAT